MFREGLTRVFREAHKSAHKGVQGGLTRGLWSGSQGDFLGSTMGSYECPLYMSDTLLLLSIELGDSVYEEEGVI